MTGPPFLLRDFLDQRIQIVKNTTSHYIVVAYTFTEITTYRESRRMMGDLELVHTSLLPQGTLNHIVVDRKSLV